MRHNRRILRVGKIATTMNASHAGLAGHRVPAGLDEAIAAFVEVGLVVAEARITCRELFHLLSFSLRAPQFEPTIGHNGGDRTGMVCGTRQVSWKHFRPTD